MKKLVALVLCLLLAIPSAASAFAPASLEAPQSVSVYYDNGSIMVRWTLPQSITGYIDNEDLDGSILYSIDYKIDDGAWSDLSPNVTEGGYDPDSPLLGYVGNLAFGGDRVQEVFVLPDTIGAGEAHDLTNHTYSFRVRFFFEKDGVSTYVTSPWSNTAAIGKNASVPKPARLDAPTGLKAELKYDFDKKPYFFLSWANPQSIIDINKSYPILYKVDFKVGDGKWFSEEHTHDWWGGLSLASSCDFDPIEKKLVDGIEIEENTYYFRILYACEVITPRVYSGFSNTATVRSTFYSFASDYAVGFLDQAEDMGIITDRMQGQDMTQFITREEFVEIAVKFYEMVTGETAIPESPNPFKDCSNPEVLKAKKLRISAGTGDGTTFEPNAKLLRQQMATMITNTLRACFPNFEMDVAGQPDFKDQKEFAAYAINSAKFMAKYGITVGDGKGNFIPNNYCTRQEAIIFLVKSYTAQDQYLK
jgi:hypothetical protein